MNTATLIVCFPVTRLGAEPQGILYYGTLREISR